MKKIISISLLLCVLALVEASIIKFEASPAVIKENLTAFASMRCSLADTESGSQIGRRDVTLTNTTDDVVHIVSITVRRNNGEEVAYATGYDQPTAMADAGNLAVKGEVTGRDSHGYIELTWSDASRVDLGGYECEVQATDKQHHHRVYTTSLELSSEPPSVTDVIDFFKKEHNDQQQLIDNQHQLNEKQQQELEHLKQCSIPYIGFTATFSAHAGKFVIPVGQTAKFDKVLMNEGGAYDPNTGAFTCTTPGMYSFQVHILAYSDQNACFELQLNGHRLTRAFAEGDNWNTASNSAVVDLKQGDVMKALPCDSYATNIRTDAWGSNQNVFSGHLIKAATCTSV